MSPSDWAAGDLAPFMSYLQTVHYMVESVYSFSGPKLSSFIESIFYCKGAAVWSQIVLNQMWRLQA